MAFFLLELSYDKLGTNLPGESLSQTNLERGGGRSFDKASHSPWQRVSVRRLANLASHECT